VDLTSLRRVKYALGVTSTTQDHILSRLVGAGSKQIVRWLRREDQVHGNGFELKSRIEYLDPRPGERVFYPLCFPIQSVTSIYSDGYGRYTGSEQVVDSTWFVIDSDSRSLSFIIIPQIPQWVGFPTVSRGIKITYTAGLAASPVVSSWTKSADAGGSLAIGNYILGADSRAVGYVTACAAGTLSYECLAGVFVAGETINAYAGIDGSLQNGSLRGPTDVSATLTANTALSLAESEPALVEAAEMHIRFLLTNRNNFENLTVTENGSTRVSRSDLKNVYDFLPEIKSMLAPYKNNLVTA